MRTLAVLFLSVFLCMSIAVAQEQGIPNMTLSEEQITGTQATIPNTTTMEENTNGRAVKLDKRGGKHGTDLTPVERRIIIRDTFVTNAPTMGGN